MPSFAGDPDVLPTPAPMNPLADFGGIIVDEANRPTTTGGMVLYVPDDALSSIPGARDQHTLCLVQRS